MSWKKLLADVTGSVDEELRLPNKYLVTMCLTSISLITLSSAAASSRPCCEIPIHPSRWNPVPIRSTGHHVLARMNNLTLRPRLSKNRYPEYLRTPWRSRLGLNNPGSSCSFTHLANRDRVVAERMRRPVEDHGVLNRLRGGLNGVIRRQQVSAAW